MMNTEAVKHRLMRPITMLRDRSPVSVSFPPDSGIGVGNMFTYWWWAHRMRTAGTSAHVRRTKAMDFWLEVFPRLTELTVNPDQVRFLWRRTLEFDQHFPTADREIFEDFIATYLLSAPTFAGDPDEVDATVTVNVRRGDYYANPKWRPHYSFNIAAYLRLALEGSRAQAPIDTVSVVSDDPQWCREELGFLSDYGQVRFQSPDDGPVDNLVQLARAPRLVLGNSSFSYWAAYLSNVWHRGGHHLVWAPWFHRRDILEGRAWQLDPQWSVVEEIPGGWVAV